MEIKKVRKINQGLKILAQGLQSGEIKPNDPQLRKLAGYSQAVEHPEFRKAFGSALLASKPDAKPLSDAEIRDRYREK